LKITQVRTLPVKGKDDFLGYAEITIDDCFRVKDIRILQRPSGYKIAMPQSKLKSGKFKEIACALDDTTQKMIEAVVIAEYEKVVRKRTQ
jgi:stage V sporulation protein G